MKRSFSIHSDFYAEIKRLDPRQRDELLLALIAAASDEEPPPLDDLTALLLRLMLAQTQRISEVNARNGGKGGAPADNRNAAATGKTTETTETSGNKRNKPTVTVSVTDTAADTVSDTGLNTDCAELPPCGGPPRRKAMDFLLNDGSYYPVYQDRIDRWSDLYPNVNIAQQLRNAAGWLEANPAKRKTRRGMEKFINGWLMREQDRGRPPPAPALRPSQMPTYLKNYDGEF